ASGHAQIGSRQAAKSGAPVRRPERNARAARESFRLAGADLRTGRARPRLVAHGTGPLRGRIPPGRPGDQYLRLPFHAGRLDARIGRARLGCTVVSTGTGQTEMQAATLADLRA